MALRIKVEMNTTEFEAIRKALARGATKAEHAVAVQAEKDTEPLVPMDTGLLRNRTKVVGNTIIYPGPYARMLYYGKYMVNAVTGAGPSHYVDAKGDEHIKYPKGSKLKPTDRNLVFHHPGTRSHWFEASKNRNLEKWKRVAKEAISREL